MSLAKTHAKTLQGYTLHSLDGTIGKIKDIYFDDHHWTIRYLIADTGTWLNDRQVLLSPYAIVAVNPAEQTIALNVSHQQIKDSPSIDSDKPVSRQFEEDYYGYYGWPLYWGGPYMWGPYPYLERNPASWQVPTQDVKTGDPHLRSMNEVRGYDLHATDGEIGRVEDFLIDDKTWAIRYLIVATRGWWPGKKVLLAPHWIERVSWNEAQVFVNLLRADIKQAPEYLPEALLTREYEASLYHHYQRPGYWDDEPTDKALSR